MIVRNIKAEVCVICQSRRLRQITQTEALIILAIKQKLSPIIALLSIIIPEHLLRQEGAQETDHCRAHQLN